MFKHTREDLQRGLANSDGKLKILSQKKIEKAVAKLESDRLYLE